MSLNEVKFIKIAHFAHKEFQRALPNSKDY